MLIFYVDVLWSSTAAVLWDWIHQLGGPGLILLGLADNSAIPLPGSVDVLTVVLAAHQPSWWIYYAIMATAGAVLGGYGTYRLAEKGGEETLEKKIGKEKAQRIYKKLEKQEGFMVFVGAILPPPFPMVPVLTAAGVLEYPKKKFLLVLAMGRAVRYFALAWVAHIYGAAIMDWFSRYYKPLLYFLIGLAIAGALGVLIYFKWYRPRKRKKDRNTGPEQKQAEHPAA